MNPESDHDQVCNAASPTSGQITASTLTAFNGYKIDAVISFRNQGQAAVEKAETVISRLRGTRFPPDKEAEKASLPLEQEIGQVVQKVQGRWLHDCRFRAPESWISVAE